MEDIRIVFSNIMEKLLKQAHKNKNVLEYKEINDAFKNIELTPEKFEWILDYFEKQGVDVLYHQKATFLLADYPLKLFSSENPTPQM